MIEYFSKYYDKLFGLLLEHIVLVLTSVSIALLIAVPLSLLVLRSKTLSLILISLFSVVYSIPSLAMFALLIPVIGIGKKTAIFVLVLYNQYILIRNIIAAFDSIDEGVIEAGSGMGLSTVQLFTKIQLPLALPVLLGGLRISLVTTIGIATLASVISAGGLGVILFDGLRTNNLSKILWGTIFAGSLAFIVNQGISVLEKKATKKATGGV